MRRAVTLIAPLLLCCLPFVVVDALSAQSVCDPKPSVDASDPYEFVSVAIDVLAYVQSGLDASASGGEGGTAITALYGMKVAREDFACAARSILPFAASDRETPRVISAALHVYLTTASNNMNEMVEMGLTESVDLDRATDLLVSNKRIWNEVAPSAATISHVLIDYDASTGEDAPMSETTPLFITHAQRTKLMDKLVTLFGESAKLEPSGGSVGVAGAQLLYQGLSALGHLRDKDGSRT